MGPESLRARAAPDAAEVYPRGGGSRVSEVFRKDPSQRFLYRVCST